MHIYISCNQVHNSMIAIHDIRAHTYTCIYICIFVYIHMYIYIIYVYTRLSDFPATGRSARPSDEWAG